MRKKNRRIITVNTVLLSKRLTLVLIPTAGVKVHYFSLLTCTYVSIGIEAHTERVFLCLPSGRSVVLWEGYRGLERHLQRLAGELLTCTRAYRGTRKHGRGRMIARYEMIAAN